MRGFTGRFDQFPLAPNTMANVVLAANTAEAFDYPTGTDLVRLSGATTAGAAYAFVFNPASTQANWPAADISPTTNSSAQNVMVHGSDSRIYQIPRASTGFSVISPTSGIVTVEFWSRTSNTAAST